MWSRSGDLLRLFKTGLRDKGETFWFLMSTLGDSDWIMYSEMESDEFSEESAFVGVRDMFTPLTPERRWGR